MKRKSEREKETEVNYHLFAAASLLSSFLLTPHHSLTRKQKSRCDTVFRTSDISKPKDNHRRPQTSFTHLSAALSYTHLARSFYQYCLPAVSFFHCLTLSLFICDDTHISLYDHTRQFVIQCPLVSFECTSSELFFIIYKMIYVSLSIESLYSINQFLCTGLIRSF